jgi:hypothetical protein
MPQAGFPGDDRERLDLLAALAQGCRCQGRRRCPQHRLLDDETTVKRLIFYRRWNLALLRAEWLNEPNWNSASPAPPSA